LSKTLVGSAPSTLAIEKHLTLDFVEDEMVDGSAKAVVVSTDLKPFFVRRVLKEAH